MSGTRAGWIVAALLATTHLGAQERFAVLMGVNQYRAPIPSLAGAENDAVAIRDVLVSRWRFKPDNIISLQGLDASKLGVLNAMTRVLSLSAPGDQVLIFFAGHGTSAADAGLGASLPHTTGALVPADFSLGTKPALPQLVVGRQDLRPLLEALDRGGRRVLVVFDSCFSGNAVRGGQAALVGRPTLPSRNLLLNVPLPSPSTTQGRDASDASDDRYPYRNVIYFSASAEHEKAADIPEAYLKWYPTRDSKAHGAYTDALLRGLQGELPGTDADEDGAISYIEMFDAVSAFVRKRGYPQTPQLLPGATSETDAILSSPLFGSSAGFAAPTVPARKSRVGVELIGFSQHEIEALKRMDAADLQAKEPTYVMVKQKNTVRLLTAGGDPVLTAQAGLNPGELLRYVGVWDRLERLASTKGRNRIRFGYPSDGLGATRLEGDKVSFRLSTSASSWIVVFNLDPAGKARMLFPYDRKEFVALPADSDVELAGSIVSAPFGLDRVVAFSFPTEPSALLKYSGRDLPIDDDDLERVLDLLDDEPPASGAVLELYTAPRGERE